MISFRYKSSIRQVKIKTKKDLAQRMPPWLQNIFAMKNPVVGFKVSGNKYYDSESFYSRIDKFYGQMVDIIQASDQLQISFISQNLNSSSFIKPSQPISDPAKQFLAQEFPQQQQIKIVKDVKSLQQKIKDKNQLIIFFQVHQIYKKQILESAHYLKNSINPLAFQLYMKNHTGRNIPQPTYSIYIGKKLIATLNLTRQYKQTIQIVIERYSKKIHQKFNWIDPKIQRGEQRQYVYRGSIQQDNQAPSFTTYQLQQRLNQDACQDYLLKMYQQKILKKYEYLKLSQKCQENFIQFYRIFCEGAIDNDYENFRNQILMKVQNNLQILLSNVDDMDLSRPISRQEQRRQNLKKSVSNIQIVKVENYFEILDQLKSLLTPRSIAEIKTELLDQNQHIFALFGDYLSRKISKQQLASSLDNTVDQLNNYRPVSRGISRSANKVPLNQSQDMSGSPVIQQPAKPINFLGLGNKSESVKNNQQKTDKSEPKQTPPMFGSSKNQGNFSPMKYMSDIESNYKQAWFRLQKKAHLFQPQQYGLLYYYLQARDDSISNIIQQMEWDQHSSIQKLKSHLSDRIKEIMKKNFTDNQISAIQLNKKQQQFQCIYQNFQYQSDLNNFIASLKSQVTQILGSPAEKILRKKKSDGQLLDTKSKDKGKRRYSDQQQIQGVHSPKSSFSHSKTVQPSFAHLQLMNGIWRQQFEIMLKECNFQERHKQQYIRSAFKEGNPAIYSWILQFIRNDKKNVNSQEIRKDTRFGDFDYKLIGKIIPIFNEILKDFVQQGKITQKIKQWHISQIVDLNVNVLSIFELFILTCDENQFVQNLILTYEFNNHQMFFYKLYLKRLETILKEMSAHDQIGLQIFRIYPQQIKAICELFYVTGNIQDLLQNLDVVHCIEVKKRKLKVATLNFSGVNTNPFQYHDGSQQLQKLNEIMKEIIGKKQIQQYFENTKLSKIDKIFTNNSRSIRFGTNILDDEGKFLTKAQYLQKWQQQLQIKLAKQVQNTDQNIKIKLAMFDYFAYIALIKYFCAVQWDENYQIHNIKQLNPTQLINYLKQKQDQPASKIQIKQDLVTEYLMKQKIDVLFVQEGGNIDWGEKLISDYHWVKNHDSVIIFNKIKIGKAKNHHQFLKYTEKLDFNNDTVFFFSDRGYLLISGHLTSKQHKQEQGRKVFEVLGQIRKEHPMMKIIMGIDANHFMGQHEQAQFESYPKDSQEHTSTKKRTYLQVQFKKSDQLASDVKDHIITTQPLKSYTLVRVDGSQVQERQFLPNNRHPYDHLILEGQLEK